jgi:thiamine monophosphate synthase
MPGVAVSASLVCCACAGAATPNIPQVIAKAATTIAVVLRIVFIKQVENTTDLKDSFENSLI